ncbi:DUF4190 domain-containing protein [Salinispora pacifica]|uniref:DUF4190 domain-containing protein n=1 Tax=Salinispora pacifica TaxID=351187 RepID=UPI00037B5301|nr:DUF4190 domain-containing protein [Salinispora pacifica]
MQPDPSTPQSDPSTPPADPSTPPADPYAPPADPFHPPVDPWAPPADPYAPPATPVSKQPYPPPPVNPYAAPTTPPSPPPDPYAAPTAPPYPGPYGGVQLYPNAGYPLPAGRQNSLGLLSMILGIASVPLACCYVGLPVGIAAVVTGWLGQQKVEQGLADNRDQAMAGMICGAIGALLGLGWGVLNIIGLAL